MRFAATAMVDGRLADTGESVDIGAEAIFKAIGQEFSQKFSQEFSFSSANMDNIDGAALLQGGDKIVVDAQFRTLTPGIYAGGDCIASGQDLTVQAVQHGKLAAIAIDQDLNLRTPSWPI